MLVRALIMAALFSVPISCTSAYAYLDPGAASILVQAILGGVAAAGAVLTTQWSKVKIFISKFLKR
jgi:hypothetical protein